MEDHITRPQELINKYLAGTINFDESAELADWIKAHPGNKELFEALTDETYREGALQEIAGYDTEAALARIHRRFDQKVASLENQQARSIRTVFMVAATIVVLLSLGTLYYTGTFSRWFDPVSQLHAFSQEGQFRQIALPDGSKVWLSPNSSLDYPQRFNEPTRTVVLKGEAFFEVKRDTAHPFMIRSGNVTTQVLGTSFNVQARAAQTLVSVVTGRVQVAIATPDSGPIVQQVLPNERVIYRQGVPQLVKESYTGAAALLERREGGLNYQGVTMAEVATDMLSLYGIEVTLNEKLKQCTVYQRKDAAEDPYIFLNKLAIILKAKIQRNGKTIRFTGTGC